MTMVADLIPGLKRFLRPLEVSQAGRGMVTRLIITFLFHAGRMSCLQTAGAIRTEPRHRAQVGRLLRRPSFRCQAAVDVLRINLVLRQQQRGRYIFIVDATLFTQAGKKTENT